MRTASISFASGAVAGAVVKTITAPLSRSTILLQTASNNSIAHAIPGTRQPQFAMMSLSYLGQVRTVDGLATFWKGNWASILQKMATTGSNYVVYEKAKTALRPFWRDELDVGFGVRLSSGVLAGATNITITYPLDLARTNISSSRGTAKEGWHTISATLYSLYNAHGWGFLRRGLLCTQLCQGLNVGLHFGIYETLSTLHAANTKLHRAPRTSWAYSFACGSIAGLVASTLVHPLDLVRRRQQLRSSPTGERWFFEILADIVRRDGFHALYRGIAPELIKVCVIPTSGLNFLIYEFIRQDIFCERSGVR